MCSRQVQSFFGSTCGMFSSEFRWTDTAVFLKDKNRMAEPFIICKEHRFWKQYEL